MRIKKIKQTPKIKKKRKQYQQELALNSTLNKRAGTPIHDHAKS